MIESALPILEPGPTATAHKLGVKKWSPTNLVSWLRDGVGLESISSTGGGNQVGAIASFINSFDARRRVLIADAIGDKARAVEPAQAIAGAEPHKTTRIAHQIIDEAAAQTISGGVDFYRQAFRADARSDAETNCTGQDQPGNHVPLSSISGSRI